jgi:hypothetical protein
MIEHGTFDPRATTPRLIVIHSRTPAIALPLGWLEGPYDEEWAIDQQTGDCGATMSAHSTVGCPKVESRQKTQPVFGAASRIRRRWG